MKKQIILLTTLLLGALTATMAQVSPTSTTVNLILEDVIAFDNGSVAAGGQVDFNFITADDYNSGHSVDVPNSLIVTSTRNFDVHVKADDTSFTDGTNNIPVSVLKIKVITGGNTNASSTNIPEVTLSNSDKLLAGDVTKGSKLVFDLNYSISALDASTVILGKPAGTYTQTVTYTATAI